MSEDAPARASLRLVGFPDAIAANWRVAGYRLLEEIGRGGMAVVYRDDERLDRQVAVKTLPRSRRRRRVPAGAFCVSRWRLWRWCYSAHYPGVRGCEAAGVLFSLAMRLVRRRGCAVAAAPGGAAGTVARGCACIPYRVSAGCRPRRPGRAP